MSWRDRVAEFLVRFGYRVVGADMLVAANRLIGRGLDPSLESSGEKWVLEHIIFKFLKKTDLVFDIGANRGEYARTLLHHFNPNSVFLFEPNPNCIDFLSEFDQKQIKRLAVGSQTNSCKFYFPSADRTSTHSSISPASMDDSQGITDIEVQMTRIDDFLSDNQIECPRFIKIDTEGNDLEVIKGLGRFISEIDFIQFEFNDMYISRKVFIKDFYELLFDTFLEFW